MVGPCKEALKRPILWTFESKTSVSMETPEDATITGHLPKKLQVWSGTSLSL